LIVYIKPVFKEEEKDKREGKNSVVSQYIGLRESNNFLRFLTGLSWNRISNAIISYFTVIIVGRDLHFIFSTFMVEFVREGKRRKNRRNYIFTNVIILGRIFICQMNLILDQEYIGKKWVGVCF
jgi:hypothetical protein